MRALLDVNVLVALLDAGHLHHRMASAWLVEQDSDGWASCPLTQNGCIRVLSLPSYPNQQPAARVADRLAAAAAHGSHEFWPDSFSMLGKGAISWLHVLSGRQVTDVYLLGLAVSRGATLATFDRGIPLGAVPGAQPQHLTVLGV